MATAAPLLVGKDYPTAVERRFFLCSIAPEAANFARAVRGHWAIENTLHWSLDVSFGEDQCRV